MQIPLCANSESSPLPGMGEWGAFTDGKYQAGGRGPKAPPMSAAAQLPSGPNTYSYVKVAYFGPLQVLYNSWENIFYVYQIILFNVGYKTILIRQ